MKTINKMNKLKILIYKLRYSMKIKNFNYSLKLKMKKVTGLLISFIF